MDADGAGAGAVSEYIHQREGSTQHAEPKARHWNRMTDTFFNLSLFLFKARYYNNLHFPSPVILQTIFLLFQSFVLLS